MTGLDSNPRRSAELFAAISDDALRLLGTPVHLRVPLPDGGGLLLHGAPGGGGIMLSVVDEWSDTTAVPLPEAALRALRDALSDLLPDGPA